MGERTKGVEVMGLVELGGGVAKEGWVKPLASSSRSPVAQSRCYMTAAVDCAQGFSGNGVKEAGRNRGSGGVM